MKILTAALLAGAFALPFSGAAAAFDAAPHAYVAKKDHEKGGGKGHGKRGHHGKHGHGAVYIPDNNRTVIINYYGDEFARGRCPPGLAKKNNGCLPPGQAKRAWSVGYPLPHAVYYDALPGALLTNLAPPPYGYDYVRVGPDVLLIEAATRMIIDAFTLY